MQELEIEFEDDNNDSNEKLINIPPFNSNSKTSKSPKIIITEEFAKKFETPKIIPEEQENFEETLE